MKWILLSIKVPICNCLCFYRRFPEWCWMVCWKWKGSPSMPGFMSLHRASHQILVQITWMLPQVCIAHRRKCSLLFTVLSGICWSNIVTQRIAFILRDIAEREWKNQGLTGWLVGPGYFISSIHIWTGQNIHCFGSLLLSQTQGY